MIVAPSIVFATGGVELMSFASMARVACSVSSLMGMFEWNPGPSSADRVGRALMWYSTTSSPASRQMPGPLDRLRWPVCLSSTEIPLVWLEVRIERERSRCPCPLLSGVGQGRWGSSLFFLPWPSLRRGGLEPFAGWPSNPGQLDSQVWVGRFSQPEGLS